MTSSLPNNLICGLRAAIFLRVEGKNWQPTIERVLLLFLFSLLAGFLTRVAAIGWEGSFNLAAAPRVFFPLVLSLLTGWMLSQRARDTSVILLFAGMVAAISIPYQLLTGVLDTILARKWMRLPEAVDAESLYTAVWMLWIAAIVLSTMRTLGWQPSKAIPAAAIVALLFVAPLWYLPASSLWEAPNVTDERDWDALRQEESFYGQSALLDKKLNELEAQRPGVTDLYFVGVAGYAPEDVFMKEMSVIDELFRQRFDTQGRRVLLINNPNTVRHTPVASATALRHTLERIGEIMDPKQDVLFLYLTSHGSAEHEFSMDFWPLQLDNLEPKMLREMLDDSGIRWRVVVISACYAGGFIDALKDERTLVITAADATRQSFGCGTESDFTYFGRAYFDQALKRTNSFLSAFAMAQDSIHQRESAEGLTPSNPQMFVGRRMSAKLAELERRMAPPLAANQITR